MSYAYSVAIKLTVANLASQGIKLLAGDLLAAHGAASTLEGKLKALKMMAVGYGLDKVGSGMLGFLEKTVDASKEYTRQLSLMNASGMQQKEIAESISAAWKTSRDVVTSTAADNLKAIRELRSVFGDDNIGDAYAILPVVQRTKAALEALTGKEQEGVGFDMVKAIEMRTHGLMTKEAVLKNADMMSRSLMAFGGTLNVNDFHMAMKQLKTQALGFSDEFVYDYLPTFIQEAKTKGGSGSSAATALRTLANAMIGGVGINKSSIPVWTEMGLIRSGDVVRNATGQFSLKPHSIKDISEFSENPFFWARDHAGAIQSYADKHHMSLLETVMSMFKNTNAQWAMFTMLAKQPQFERDRKLIESGGGSLETYQKLLQMNPQMAQQALHAQWQNILSILGYQILPRLIPYMVKFADTLDSVSQWMQKHPTMLKGIVVGIGGLAIALSVLGKVLMTAGIIKLLGIGPMLGAAGTAGAGGMAAIGAGLAVGFAAYLALNKIGPDGGAVGWLTGKVYDAIHPYNPNATPTVNVHNHYDKHGITTRITSEQVKASRKPQTGPSFFDPQTSGGRTPGGGF